MDLVGEVVGPFRLTRSLAWYANNNFGIGRPSGVPRAQHMARDAAIAADPAVNFQPYDNDGNGFVDAFVVIHAGAGGEATGNPGDIWSHKWVLPSTYSTDSTQIFAYLTIPEDARIGVCAHELGHLLFGFPDLYDTDGSSEGVGNWCLMGGGSWNGNGDVPAHPSAWCKIQQGWASAVNVTSTGTMTFTDIKSSKIAHRLWRNGQTGSEYFLAENRQRTGYDSMLPGGGPPRLARRRERSRTTPMKTTTWSGWSKPTISASSNVVATAATQAIPIPGRAPTRRSHPTQHPARTPTRARAPRYRSATSRHRPRA